MSRAMKVSILVAVVFGMASRARADDAIIWNPAIPDPNTVYVTQVTMNGTGCPAGTVAVNFTPDFSMLELTFSAFVAQIGPGTMPADWRKNCILAVTFHVPAGYTFALIGANYRGFAQLDPGVTGTQTTSYFIAGQQGSYSLSSHVPADLDADGNYQRFDQIPSQSWVWSPCGANAIANMNASVSLNNSQNRSGSGLITLDETDISPQLIFNWHFAWQSC